MATIELTGVSRTVPVPDARRRLTPLDRVDLRVEPGERVAVLGPSGSGKSTLLSVVGMLAPATAGTYLLDGQDVRRLRGRRRDRLRIRTFGFVFQRPCLLAHLSAVENVEVALLHHAGRRADKRARSLCALRSVGLADRAGHRPGQLSGGEQQRVAVARALVAEPSVVLADEPTAALDDATGRTVMALLHALATARGTSMMVVTHDPAMLHGFDRTVTVDQGRVVAP